MSSTPLSRWRTLYSDRDDSGGDEDEINRWSSSYQEEADRRARRNASTTSTTSASRWTSSLPPAHFRPPYSDSPSEEDDTIRAMLRNLRLDESLLSGGSDGENDDDDGFDPFRLLDDQSICSMSNESSSSPAFMNIQLMGCRKIADVIQRSLLRLYFAKLISAVENMKASEAQAVAFHNKTLTIRSLHCWHQHAQHEASREKTILQSLAEKRRIMHLRSHAIAWRQLVQARRVFEALRRHLIRRALHQWLLHTKVSTIINRRQQNILLQTLTDWRRVVRSLSAERVKNAALSAPPASTLNTTAKNCTANDNDQTLSSSPPPNTDKENVSNGQRKLGKAREKPLTQMRRTPKIVVDMERRQAARMERRQELKRRQTEAQKQRELALQEERAKRESALRSHEEAELQLKAEEEMRRKLDLEQQKQASRLAVLHRKINLLRQHFRRWKAVSVDECQWKDKKAHALWYDTVLGRSLRDWRLQADAAKNDRIKRADSHFLQRFFSKWRYRTRHVTSLRHKIQQLHVHYSKKRVLNQWISAHYRIDRASAKIEKVAIERGRVSVLRWAMLRWKDGAAVLRTEREIEERIQKKKRQVHQWLLANTRGRE